jgi:SAM-dependent methyltransferase
MEDVSNPDFWNERYLANSTGWEKGRCAPPIARMLAEGLLPAGSHIAVVGAGRGNEALEAARLGYRVTAIDFAPEAAIAIRRHAETAGVDVAVLEADLFSLKGTHAGAFHAVLEHTCFCAIDVGRRDEYVEVMHAVLGEGGLLFGLFYVPSREGGPPYTTSEAELRVRFERRFELVRLARPDDSFPERLGEELEVVARRTRFEVPHG